MATKKAAKKSSAKPKADAEDSAAEFNNQPHPEFWPSPDTAEDAEANDPSIEVVPESPNTHLEFTIKAHGLPVSTGVVFKLENADATGQPTFLTNKTSPLGDATVVWRSQVAGEVEITVMAKRNNELAETFATHTLTIVDPAEDTRFGEERGAA